MRSLAASMLVASLTCAGQLSTAQTYDSIIGEAATMATPGAHWFSVKGNDIAYLVNGDTGRVEGTLTLSKFSPAIEPALSTNRIYSYGSFYSRTYYGDRTDVVLVFDRESNLPIKEVEIPPKSAGIGHGGMIGLIDERFIGVWNITPAMSVSLVDTSNDSFIGEISTPGCAGVYPVEHGFLMPCADGRVQYIRLNERGQEVARLRSEAFFHTADDPVFDYAVPSDNGWLFLSLDGLVHEVSLEESSVAVSPGWSINPPDEEGAKDLNGVAIPADDHWRIGGKQPFAYNAEHKLLVTVMHKGGGQETFEDPGTQIWALHTETGRRAYVLELEEGVTAGSVELTGDSEPLLLIATSKDGELRIHDALSSRLLRTVDRVSGRFGSAVQRLQ